MEKAPQQIIDWIRRYSPKELPSGFLGNDNKVASQYLPSYVDDVIEVANYAALPATGETDVIYVTLDDNKLYRWTGSTYVELSGEDTTDDMTLDFTGGLLTYTFYAPYAMQIDSVTNVLNAPTTTITKNAAPYTLGTSIALGNTMVVTVSTASVVRLNYTKL